MGLVSSKKKGAGYRRAVRGAVEFLEVAHYGVSVVWVSKYRLNTCEELKWVG